VSLHEIITCDVCNEDGEIDPELIGSLDDGMERQISGNDEQAEAAGWACSPGDAYVEHVCPACLTKGSEDDGTAPERAGGEGR
jgi:hypothetical protein